MNPNDSIVLSTSSIVVPSLLGSLIWPHFIFAAIGASFLLFSCLFFVFKRRNQTK